MLFAIVIGLIQTTWMWSNQVLQYDFHNWTTCYRGKGATNCQSEVVDFWSEQSELDNHTE